MIIAPKRYSQENITINFIDERKAITNKSLEALSSKMKDKKIFDGLLISNQPLSSLAEKVVFKSKIS